MGISLVVTAHAEVHRDMQENLATKDDMAMLEQRIETNMANMKVSLIYWMVDTQIAALSIVCTVFGVVMGVLHT